MNPVARGHRCSVRLPAHDYGGPGAYFITVVAQGGEAVFGNIAGDGVLVAEEAGRIVRATWEGLERRFTGLTLDAFVLMPNHIHGVVVIEPACRGAVSAPSPRQGAPSSGIEAAAPPTGVSLARVVAYLKYQSTKSINAARGTPGLRVWQRNYYEHVVRNDEELNRIREYIMTNPPRWALDRENPAFRSRGARHG
ncbi:MAG: hypothetical protein M0Z94_04150 [Dehalococcoidales bacterium]|nr:hypothetical protein [Dehalococcoidales bacterium]